MMNECARGRGAGPRMRARTTTDRAAPRARDATAANDRTNHDARSAREMEAAPSHLAPHEVGTAVCTALIQQLLHNLRQARSRERRAALGVQTAVALVQCACSCRAWLDAVIPRLVLLLSSAFEERTRIAAARALRGLLRGQSGVAQRQRVAASDVLPPLLMMVQHDDRAVAMAGAELAAELGRECEARCCEDGVAGCDASVLMVIPALTTAVSDAAAAAGQWPVRVVEHRPALMPGHKGHLSVLDIRSDAFAEPVVPDDRNAGCDCVEVCRQLVLGVWEVGGDSVPSCMPSSTTEHAHSAGLGTTVVQLKPTCCHTAVARRLSIRNRVCHCAAGRVPRIRNPAQTK